jgi:hypothetical protein
MTPNTISPATAQPLACLGSSAQALANSGGEDDSLITREYTQDDTERRGSLSAVGAISVPKKESLYSIYLLDGREIGRGCVWDWQGVEDYCAWFFGCHHTDVALEETSTDDGDCTEWLRVKGEIVGTVGHPASPEAVLAIK